MCSSSLRSCHQFTLEEIKDARNDFGKSKLLGQGGEAKVYLSEVYIEGRKTQVAVKHLYPRSSVLEKEIQTDHNIQHPHIVSLLGYCEGSGQKILVYEYMENGSLSDYVKGEYRLCLSWEQRLNICIGAARGLQHLHNGTKENPFGMVHRDVKPGNILVNANWVGKVSDFGLLKLSHSNQEKSSMATEVRGTAGYYAPEYLKSGHVTRRVDIYAFGVVLFEVLCGKMPWDRGGESYYREDDEDLGLHAQKNVDIKIKGEISVNSLEAFTDIISRSLRKIPNERPTIDDVVLGLEKALRCQEKHQPSCEGCFHRGFRHSIREGEGEQARGEKMPPEENNTEEHGTLPHRLVKLESNDKFMCDACQTVDRGTRYRCSSCDFDLHEYCATCPNCHCSLVRPHMSPYKPGLLNCGPHMLILVSPLKEYINRFCTVCHLPVCYKEGPHRICDIEGPHRICSVCIKPLKGLFYRCTHCCDFEAHPLCT